MPDNRVVAGGSFSAISGFQFDRVGRFQTNGEPDLNFNSRPGFNGVVTALSIKEDGRIVVGGSFTLPTRGVTQLRSDGTVDTAFNPGLAADAPVHAVLIQGDGRIIIGGVFATVDGQPRTRVARFNLNGFLDDSFQPFEITSGTVFALAQQSDGKVIVGGDFTTSAGTNRVTLVRLNTDGSIDSTFLIGSGPNDVVYDIVVQPTDKIIIGGSFTSIDGVSRPRFARLRQNGSIDTTFDPGTGANNTVYSLALLPDNDLIIAGDFTQVRGVARNRVARIVANETPAMSFTGFVVTPDKPPRLTIMSNPGRTYVLEKSSNLLSWTPVTTNLASSATLDLVDPELPTASQRFYRAVER
jgi:uncharacterized delta-60 repeat protein